MPTAFSGSAERLGAGSSSCHINLRQGAPAEKLQDGLSDEAILENQTFALRLQWVRIARFPAEIEVTLVILRYLFRAARAPERRQDRAYSNWRMECRFALA
jgi:hypothetical protein